MGAKCAEFLVRRGSPFARQIPAIRMSWLPTVIPVDFKSV